MSEPKRYSDLDVWKALHFGENTSGWVKYEDYARIQAEVERLTKHDDDTCPHLVVLGRLEAENARFKAEVERLTAFTTRTIIPNELLQAQVERLTKAGDAMELTLQADFNGCPYEPLIVRNAIIYWRNAKDAAKEGHNMWGIVAPYVVPPCIDSYTAKWGKQP